MRWLATLVLTGCAALHAAEREAARRKETPSTIAGRVLDREGRPLAGVRVFQAGDDAQLAKAATDDEGRFALTRIADGPAIVFAERDGYRFTGQWAPAAETIELVLTQDNQPAASLTSGPLALLARNEELALARRVVWPFVERALELGKPNEQYWALVHWARLHPGDALERLESGAHLTSDQHDTLRTWAANLDGQYWLPGGPDNPFHARF